MQGASGVAAEGRGLAVRYELAGRLLRVALVVLLLGSVLTQVIVPGQATIVGTASPEVAYLVVPYSAAAILFIVCVQVALLVVWRLLSLVDGGVIFTRRALPWVDVIIGCAVVATVLSAGVLVHMLIFVPGNGGPMGYYMVASITGGLAFALCMIVLRGLLESAIGLAHDSQPAPRQHL
ncbi:MAG TPA: DUF2975 domain-containing protein [Candidatus Limnocylindrales bacterium]|nr:DUF2975 domain-containing protein [Candidatus Limnocylindrales bacterium]